MKEHDSMDWTRIETLHDAYGANPDRWPEDERAAALTLMARDPERADALRRDALALDETLSDWVAPPVSHEIADRMQTSARPGFLVTLRAKSRSLLGWQGPLWQPAGAFAAALMLGLAIGGVGPDPVAFLTGETIAQTDAVEDTTTDDLESLILDLDGLMEEKYLS